MTKETKKIDPPKGVELLCLSCTRSKVLWNILPNCRVRCKRLGNIDAPSLCIYYIQHKDVASSRPEDIKKAIETAVKQATDRLELK